MIRTKENLSLKELAKIEVKTPKNAGKYWRGVKHTYLIELFRKAIKKAGYALTEQTFVVSPDKADISACFTVNSLGTPWLLGVQSSNARRFCAKVFFGRYTQMAPFLPYSLDIGKVTKGLFSKDVAIETICMERLHELKIPLALAEDVMINKAFSTHGRDAIYAQVCRGHARIKFPWSKLGLVDKLVGNPHRIINGWNLYKAFSDVVATCPPMRQMGILNNIAKLIHAA